MSVCRVMTCDVRWVSDNEVGVFFLIQLLDWARQKYYFDWVPVRRHDAYRVHIEHVKHSCSPRKVQHLQVHRKRSTPTQPHAAPPPMTLWSSDQL